jgi:GntR family transcriptional regulator/MocR family aminotransferase
MGGILPLARRMQLLDWAARESAFVVEDDYDGEYRYDGRPIPCLQGLDERGCVLYVGSTSKLLFPALRVGWVVLPEALVPAFAQAKALADTGSATLEQLALADFIAGGHLERHVRRTRAKNALRREALAAAVAKHLAGVATLAGVGAGLHGLLWVPSLPASREVELRKRCARLGVGIYPVLPFCHQPPPCAGFVLGFSALEPEAIDAGVKKIARALEALSG